ncbi:MAG: serine/threonine protein kinase, partial [Verrucomicrobiae bacterium]|nr:serine/threonine protein kinase [Verrucomicrobiae bacterium]
MKEELEDILKTRALVARSLENIPPQQLPNLTETFEQSKPNSSTGQTLQYPDGDQPGYIGRYAITETIGKSGYGTVYKAFDERLDREVAVKVPRLAMKSTDSQTDLETAFLHEARKVARLRHPNIVTVHDIGVAEDRCYIVAEYLHGPNLTNWLLNRNPSWKEAARLAAEIADGLASAHASGIVHRDVKPA